MRPTHTLPHWLGSHPVDRIEATDADGYARVWVRRPDGAVLRLTLLLADLVEVAPPLPPEPPYGFIGRAGKRLWERDDDAERDERCGPGRHWWLMGDDQPYTYEVMCEINDDTPLTQLAPDPAADAPPLPWHIGSCRREASVYQPRPIDDDGSIMVHVHVRKDDYTIDECRQMAAVLLRAARDHEQEAGR